MQTNLQVSSTLDKVGARSMVLGMLALVPFPPPNFFHLAKQHSSHLNRPSNPNPNLRLTAYSPRRRQDCRGASQISDPTHEQLDSDRGLPVG
jgi:hypothetical protein